MFCYSMPSATMPLIVLLIAFLISDVAFAIENENDGKPSAPTAGKAPSPSSKPSQNETSFETPKAAPKGEDSSPKCPGAPLRARQNPSVGPRKRLF
ncbi:hypothetical protein niasHT_032090 [Heterodera trifolii]|uniref:Uncharacterized protein n=1 Tax=Heterodera trifolii TaxID=157864 RepID=A0ABD2ID32_9BILA